MSKETTITFRVVGKVWDKKAGKNPKYKVSLKSKEGHAMTLIGDSKAIFEGFPDESKVLVKILPGQRTLDETEVPEE